MPVTALAFSVALRSGVSTVALLFHGLAKGGAGYCVSGRAGYVLSTQIPVGLRWKQKPLLGSFLNNLAEFKRIPTHLEFLRASERGGESLSNPKGFVIVFAISLV